MPLPRSMFALMFCAGLVRDAGPHDRLTQYSIGSTPGATTVYATPWTSAAASSPRMWRPRQKQPPSGLPSMPPGNSTRRGAQRSGSSSDVSTAQSLLREETSDQQPTVGKSGAG